MAGEELIELLKRISKKNQTKEKELDFFNYFHGLYFDASNNLFPYYRNLYLKAFLGPKIFRAKAKKELEDEIIAQYNHFFR